MYHKNIIKHLSCIYKQFWTTTDMCYKYIIHFFSKLLKPNSFITIEQEKKILFSSCVLTAINAN